MKIVIILILSISIRAPAMTCSGLIKHQSSKKIESMDALIDSELLYSIGFTSAVADTIEVISSKGVYRSVMKDVLESGNLSDLEPLAEAVYRNMNTGRFSTAQARALYEIMPPDVIRAHITDALLLNAKYKEAVSIRHRSKLFQIQNSGELASELGFNLALPIWLGSASLAYLTNNTDILIGGGVVTITSLAAGAVGLYNETNSDPNADKIDVDFKKKLIEDLSTIRSGAYRGQATPVLMLAIDEALASGDLDKARQEPISRVQL